MKQTNKLIPYKVDLGAFSEQEIHHIPEWQRVFTLYIVGESGTKYYTPSANFKVQTTIQLIEDEES